MQTHERVFSGKKIEEAFFKQNNVVWRDLFFRYVMSLFY